MSKSKKPNILIIMTDQHSPHFLGCYGNKLVRTPNLDELAASGIRFDNCYCSSPLCVPSRMSFMTGRTPGRNQVWNNSNILNSNVFTWAHALGEAGYLTSLIGRMHFVGPDQHHGFEERVIGELCSGQPGSWSSGGPAWTKYPSITCGQRRESVEYSGKGSTMYQWYDETVTAAACEYLKEATEGKKNRPFAAVVGYILPHCPFISEHELFDYYYDKIEMPDVEEEQPETIKRFRRIRDIFFLDIADKNKKVALAAYCALCEQVDRAVGKVLDKLKDTGLSEDTLVIYCSDHGESAGEHGCWWKSNYYQCSASVPFIAKWSGVIQPGTNSDAVCNLYDIAPTLTEIAGVDIDCDYDGSSLLDIMKNGVSPEWRNETFSELCDIQTEHDLLPSRMIRSGKWKLWVYDDREGLPPALFDLENDPDELNNLGHDPAHAKIREELIAKVYSEWEPERVVKQSKQSSNDFGRIANWTRKTNPPGPYLVEMPSADYESDVELIYPPNDYIFNG